MSLGQTIKARRKALKRTQADCAQRADMARTNWLRLEQRTSDPQLCTLVKVATALDCVVVVHGSGLVELRDK